MAISRIRGEQIRQKVLVNQHIADDAAINESKLDVNWGSHYAQALETKKVVDFVQVGNKSVSGLSEFNLSVNGVLAGDAPITTSAGVAEGVITDAPYNKVVIRDANSGDSFVDELDNEVYGRLVHDGVDFKVLFFSVQGETETAFTMPVDAEIDFQYMERFNLRTISELFAANEKFVAGAADITAFQNIHQLARDIYGSGYSLDRDGEGNLQVSLAEQISDEVQARQEEMAQHKADLLAAGEAGKGAHLIGIEDLANVFTAVTVEGALAELEGRLQDVEQSGGVEVTEARDSSVTGAHATLDARIEADVAELIERLTTEQQRAEAAEQDLADRATALETEVQDARKSDAKGTLDVDGVTVLPKEFASVDARLEEIEADHKAEVTRATDEEARIEGKLDSEIQNRTDEIARVDQAIADEAERATGAEEALAGRATALEEEMQAARGTEASVDARLDKALNEDGTLKAGAQIHSHHRARYQAQGGENEVLLTAFNKVGLPNFQVGDDSLEVFINGQLQEPGLNYQEGSLGEKIIFDLGDGTVLEPTDIVQIKYFINNEQ